VLIVVVNTQLSKLQIHKVNEYIAHNVQGFDCPVMMLSKLNTFLQHFV